MSVNAASRCDCSGIEPANNRYRVADNGALHLHVFSCDGYTITQRYTDPTTNGWATGSLDQPASAVSATAWSAGGSGSIRVYCTSDDGTAERCLDGGGTWYQGQFSTD